MSAVRVVHPGPACSARTVRTVRTVRTLRPHVVGLGLFTCYPESCFLQMARK